MKRLCLLMLSLSVMLVHANEGDSVSGFYGSFSTTIPISVPSYHGLEPKLELSFNSGGGPSWIGKGWSLKGYSFIERATAGGGTPDYTNNDIYYMDGVELIPSNELGGTHCARIQNYSRIVKNSTTWTVTGTNGNVATYSPLFITSKGNYRWYLTSIRDPKGNQVTYHYYNYSGNDIYLDSISYNGSEIIFHRELSPDEISFATGSSWGLTRYRLSSIEVRVGSSRARVYNLDHRNSLNTGRNLLGAVTQYGRDAVINGNGKVTSGTALPSMTFEYQDDLADGIYTAQSAAPTGGWNAGYVWRGDYDGDGLGDILSYSSGWFTTFFANGDGTYEEVKGSAPTTGWNAGLVWTGDYDGDGLDDILSYHSYYLTAFLSNGNGTYTAKKTYVNTSWHSSYAWSGDYDGDGRTDLMSYYNGWFTTFKANSNGTFTIQKGSAPTSGWNAGLVWKGDYNNDGRADILSYHSYYLTAFISNGNGTYNPVKTYVNTSWHSSYAWAGDYDGDGFGDLMSYYGGWFTTFRNNGNGTFTIQKGSAPTSGWNAGRVWVGDYNADGRTDLRSYESGLMATFESNGNGTYRHISENAPTSGWHAGYVWPNDYDGDGRTDLLSYYSGTFTTFFAVGSLRGAMTTLRTSTTSSGWDAGRVWTGDFNGDGKADILSYYGSQMTTFTSQGSGGSYNVLRGAVPGSGWHAGYAWANDYDADGKTDLLSYNSGWFTTFKSQGNGNYTVLKGTAPTTGWDANYVWPGDYNGDGKGDLLSYKSGRFTTFISNGDGTYQHLYSTAPTGGWDAGRVWPGDYNGDGKADICSYYGGKLVTFFSNGDGTYRQYNDTVPTSGWSADYTWRGDYNGDGKADLLSYYSGTFTTYFSNGFGDFRMEQSTAPTHGWHAGYVWPGDYNNDGRTDIVSYHDYALTTFSSKGDGSYHTNKQGVTGSGWNAGRVWPGDYNGDGRADLLSYHGAQFTTFQADGNTPDLMLKLTNGTGGTTDIDYTPSSAWSNTMLPIGVVLHTVTSLTTSDGRGTSGTVNYNYEGGLWSPEERRFLGFRKVTSILDAQGNYTETYYLQQVGSTSKPEVTYYKDNQGKIFNFSSYTYDYNLSPPYTSLMTQRWDYECNQTNNCRRSLVQFGYDQYGNVTTVHDWGDYDKSGDESTRMRGYATNNNLYIQGLPAYEALYSGIGTNTLLELTRYADDNKAYMSAPTKGNVTTIDRWDDTTQSYLSRQLAYDSYGNLIRETDERGNATTVTFDSTYKVYPVSATNPLGHKLTRTWDMVIGQELSSTDANGATISTTYDALGRKQTVTFADGNTTTFSYINQGDPSSQRVRETKPDGSSDGLWEETWTDGLGRIWKVVQEGGITKETRFSGTSDRVWKESQPFFSGDTPIWTTYTYDGINRLRTVTFADGARSEIVYGMDGSKKPYEANYDEMGNERLMWKDKDGRVLQVRERVSGVHQFTNYTYDPRGHMTAAINDNGNQTLFTWDSLGRKTRMVDPDMGTWNYAYDVAGLLTTQTDAKGQKTQFTYDALGRMETKTDGDGNLTEWFYDENGHGYAKGRLTRVEYAGGSREHYWSLRGLEDRTIYEVGGVSKVIDRDFDSLGRLSAITYPDGETVTYGYNGNGKLKSASGYVTHMTWNASDRLTSMTYANGTSTTFDYDPYREWLESANVKRGNTALFQATYGYDDAARMTDMSSTTNPLSNVSYSYDNLNRLKTVTGSVSESFSYDNLGNMTYSNAHGTNQYGDSKHIHALTKAGNVSYAYDANGSMTQRGGQTLTWDAENRLARVQNGSSYLLNFYGEDTERIRSTTNGSTTDYFGSYVETKNGIDTQHIFVGPVRVAAKRLGDVDYFHADHLGSVRLITDEYGNVKQSNDYSAYGQLLQTSGNANNTRGFNGHITESDFGLVYMNARFYDPALGRFISADAIVPDPANPQALNRYAYVYNNPITNIDPSGHAPVAAAVLSAVITTSVTTSTVITATAWIGAGLSVAGYYTENPWLSTIGSVMLGFSGGYANPGNFSNLTGGIVGATGAALTSPVSPLSPGTKQAVGWAFSAAGQVDSFRSAVEFASHNAANVAAQIGVSHVAEKMGIDGAEFNVALTAISFAGNKFVGTRFQGVRHSQAHGAVNVISGVSSRGMWGLPFDVVDIVLGYQGLPTATAYEYMFTANHQLPLLGFSLGSLDANNLGGMGVPGNSVTSVSLPAFNSGAPGVQVYVGTLDPVNGFSFFGKMFSPYSTVQSATLIDHANGNYPILIEHNY